MMIFRDWSICYIGKFLWKCHRWTKSSLFYVFEL